jgi:SAM-dependent methyltransferase
MKIRPYLYKLERFFERRFLAWLIRMSKSRSRHGLYEFLTGNYRMITDSARVLSVGAGGEINRLLSVHSRRRGFKSLSLDIDLKRNPDIVGDICMHGFKDKVFDVVILSEVLEHLYSPTEGLQNIYRILKPGGKLILSAPFIMPIHDQPNDFFRFTRYGLALLLRKFRQVEISELNSYFEAIDVLWVRLIQNESMSARFASFFIIPIVYFLKRPLTILLSRLIPTSAMTTGYGVIALK